MVFLGELMGPGPSQRVMLVVGGSTDFEQQARAKQEEKNYAVSTNPRQRVMLVVGSSTDNEDVFIDQ